MDNFVSVLYEIAFQQVLVTCTYSTDRGNSIYT